MSKHESSDVLATSLHQITQASLLSYRLVILCKTFNLGFWY